jgi:hypothetical protein
VGSFGYIIPPGGLAVKDSRDKCRGSDAGLDIEIAAVNGDNGVGEYRNRRGGELK